MTCHGDEAFPALSDEHRARLPGQSGPGDADPAVRTLQAPRSWPHGPTASSARYSPGIR
jgi:hypothetical protein